MAIFIQRLTRAVAIALALSVAVPYAVKAQVTPVVAQIDSLSSSVDALESKVLSTLMFGGSSPVSFSGEARLKMQFHNMTVYPEFMANDRTYLQSGWEGNENLFRLGMVVRPGRNTVLWSKIGLTHVLTGDYFSEHEVPTRRDKNKNTTAIHEDMNAGIAIRTIPASFWLKLGNTHWTEASPLTVWKSQPRTFAWEYLPFEIEQPIARYYEYNIAKGEKSGRAAWNKKPFNGINLESISLPWNLYTNFVYGTFERYDNCEREFLDLSSNDLSYSGDTKKFKSHGIGDSYRKVLHGRIARNKTFGDVTLGLNYTGIDYSDDVLYASFSSGEKMIKKQFRVGKEQNLIRDEDSNVVSQGKVFYKEPKILSLDMKGPLNEQFSIHSDVGFSLMDTTWWTTDSDGVFTTKEQRTADPAAAFYSNIKYNGLLPMEADIAAIGKGFYSPFSFAVPMDAFFAYGSNMVGAGKFIARGEGSPYTQNMAGINLTFMPKFPGYGHCRIKYGQHFQLEEGKDILFFPYRLNGADMYTFFHSSYNRWGNGPIDYSMDGTHKKRLGDQSYRYITGEDPMVGPQAGGMRSDFLSIYEGFAAYDTKEEAMANYLKGYFSNSESSIFDYMKRSSIVDESYDLFHYYDTTARELIADTFPTNSSWVPVNQKFTFNLELDAAYDIGPYLGYDNDLFFGGYAAINGVSRSFKPLSFSDEADDMLLWSFYLRLEPAIALSNKFYILGLVGYETWRSQKSWMFQYDDPDEENPNYRNIKLRHFQNVPIHYSDFAVGIGFDWDILERVGLHTRVKWMSHKDKHVEDNNFQTPVASMELKTWF